MVLTGIGWAVGGVSFIVFFATLSESTFIYSLGGAVLIAVSGVLVIAVSQMGLAQIATAENNRDMLENMRKPSNFSTATIKENRQSFYKGKKCISLGREIDSRIKVYKNKEILKAPNGVFVRGAGNRTFNDILEAEKWINENDNS